MAAHRPLAEILALLQPPISPDQEIWTKDKLERGPEFPPALESCILTWTQAPHISTTAFQEKLVKSLHTVGLRPVPASPRVSSCTWVPRLPDQTFPLTTVKMAPLIHPSGLCLSAFAVSRKLGRPGQAPPPQGPPSPLRVHLSGWGFARLPSPVNFILGFSGVFRLPRLNPAGAAPTPGQERLHYYRKTTRWRCRLRTGGVGRIPRFTLSRCWGNAAYGEVGRGGGPIKAKKKPSITALHPHKWEGDSSLTSGCSPLSLLHCRSRLPWMASFPICLRQRHQGTGCRERLSPQVCLTAPPPGQPVRGNTSRSKPET